MGSAATTQQSLTLAYYQEVGFALIIDITHTSKQKTGAGIL